MENIEQDLDDVRRQRNQFQDLHAAFTPMRAQPRTAFGAEKYRQFVWKDYAWLLSGIAVVIASVVIIWLILSGQEAAKGISDSLIGEEKQNTPSTTPEVKAIDDAAQVLETLPVPAAGQISRQTSVEKMPRQTDAGGAADPQDTPVIASATTTTAASLSKPDRAEVPASTTQGTDSVEGGQSSAHELLHTATSVDKEGPWIINLVSSPSKADADRFAEKARSRAIETVQQQVTVNGKQYWRVQIAGFSTAAEARDYAVTAKEKLELNDVWISKH